MPYDEYGNYTDENGTQGPPQDPMQPQRDATLGALNSPAPSSSTPYTPETGGMPASPAPASDSTPSALPASPAPSPAPAVASTPEGSTLTPPAAPALPAAPATNLPGPGAPILPNLGTAYQAAAGASQGQQTADNGVNDAYRQALLGVLNQSQQAPSINDATLAPQAKAYEDAQQRSVARNRAAMAERYASEGLNSGGAGSGAFDTGIQGMQDQSGQQTAQYEAGLVGQETQQRRQQLTQALALANAVGARSEAGQLQRELALLQGSQNQQALGGQLGLSYAELEAQQNRDALLAAMGR